MLANQKKKRTLKTETTDRGCHEERERHRDKEREGDP